MIDKFKAMVVARGGFSKVNRFGILLTLPKLIGSRYDAGRDLSLLCESASIPGKQITTTEYSAYGYNQKIPTGLLLDDVTFTFNLTSDYYAKIIFDDWQNLVIDPNSFLVLYESDYKTNITITQLNDKNEENHSVTLIGAYPITVNTISFDNQSENQIQKLSVTFAYTKIKTVDSDATTRYKNIFNSIELGRNTGFLPPSYNVTTEKNIERDKEKKLKEKEEEKERKEKEKVKK